MATTSLSSFSCLYKTPPSCYPPRDRHAKLCFSSKRVTGPRLRRCGLMVVRATQDGENQEGGSSDFFSDPIKWLFGSVFLVAIPIWRRIQNAGNILEKTDDVVEKIETIADKVGNVAREIAEELPDDSRMKKVVLKVEQMAERVEDGADKLDNIIDKITDSIDEIEDSLEEAKEKKKEREKAEK